MRYRRNDYSVPTAYGHRKVLVRGYVHEVVIACGAEVIARHPRSYEREDFVFNPLHYLALLEQKTNALDQAAPLADWKLPEEFATLRRLLEARMGKPGKREFVQVLRLMEVFRIERRGRRRARCHRARRDWLRCREASGAVPDRAAPAAPRHDDLSVSAQGDGRDDIGALVHGSAGRSGGMTDTPQILLAHHLKALKLPTFLREYDKIARLCAAEGVDHPRYLMRLAEMEMIDRERRMVERRIKAARFPAVKSLDSFDFLALPSLNKMLVLELARSEYVERRENIIAVGNSGTGKSHIALGLGSGGLPEGPVGRLHHGRGPRPRTDRSAGRKAVAAPSASARRLQAADHRRTRLCAAVADRGRTAVRGLQPALRARRDHRHQQPAVRRVDIGVRFRAADRRAPRPAHASRPHPRDERRQLSARSQQAPVTPARSEPPEMLPLTD